LNIKNIHIFNMVLNKKEITDRLSYFIFDKGSIYGNKHNDIHANLILDHELYRNIIERYFKYETSFFKNEIFNGNNEILTKSIFPIEDLDEVREEFIVFSIRLINRWLAKVNYDLKTNTMLGYNKHTCNVGRFTVEGLKIYKKRGKYTYIIFGYFGEDDDKTYASKTLNINEFIFLEKVFEIIEKTTDKKFQKLYFNCNRNQIPHNLQAKTKSLV